MEAKDEERAVQEALRGRGLSRANFAETDVNMTFVATPGVDSTRLPTHYDPHKIAEFWRRQPVAVMGRVYTLAKRTGKFGLGMLWDWLTGRLEARGVDRVAELREVLTANGPAYIKLGQALSIRPDILSPRAMNELQKLCDKVPSFPNDIAMGVLEDELGQPWHEVFSEIESEPIAAASLGQVYKAKLRASGQEVAIKIQRPRVLETVSLDLALLRR